MCILSQTDFKLGTCAIYTTGVFSTPKSIFEFFKVQKLHVFPHFILKPEDY